MFLQVLCRQGSGDISEPHIIEFTCVVPGSNCFLKWKPKQQCKLLSYNTLTKLFENITGFIHFKMENAQLQHAAQVQTAVDIEEVGPTVKKPISIIDTKLAIRPFKMCPDGLEAFAQACHHKKTGGSTPEIFGIHFKRVVNNKTLNPLGLIISFEIL